MTAWLKKQWFALALVVVVGLAFRFPEWGAQGGLLRSEVTTNIGIVMLFFFQGWLLPTEVLAKSMLEWKAHVFTQVFIFLLFPAIVIMGDWIWGPFLPGHLRTGFFMLGVMPSTITSAIIYTAQSNGNTAIALVNTTFSNAAGILITPVWMTILAKAGTAEIGDLGVVLLRLSKLILLPIIAGQIAHVFWKSLAARCKPFIGHFNQTVILFIVYVTFANSVAGGIWNDQGWRIVLVTVVLSLAVFAATNVLSVWLIKLFRFPLADRSAIFFCGTQKTLGAGVPLAISMFGSGPALGVILLPLMIFHPIHLILGAVFIPYFREQKTRLSGPGSKS